MTERVETATRLKFKTDFPSFAALGGFDAVREYVVTIRAEGFKTERAARERADEVAAALEAQGHHNFVPRSAP